MIAIYDPDKAPLFVGLSVTPYVYFKETPTGPNAGKFLQELAAETAQEKQPGTTGAVPSGTDPSGAGAIASLAVPRQRHVRQAGEEAMSASAAISAAPASVAAPRTINPWLVAAAVVIPTFMEVLDTTIANVALRYIAGGLSTAVTDSEWVITSYLAANAIILPISGWLSAQLGRRNYFLVSIAVFTLASALCGMATSLAQIIMFRVLQGLAGGGLQPSSQGVLLDSFPPEKQGTAQTLFGVAALLGPIVGPTLGGWLVVNYDWRWIFYVNVPVGLLALAVNWLVVQDPEYLKKQRAELRRQPLNFDAIGLGLLALVMASWEITLSKGQEWDWLGDPFGRIQTLVTIIVVGFGLLLFREMRIKNPIVNFRVLRDRNLAVCCVIIFCVYAVLYAVSFSLPHLLQTLFGYDALASGLVMSPSGASTIAGMLLVGFLLGKGADARWLIPIGLVIVAVGNYWMSLMNLDIEPLAGGMAAGGAGGRAGLHFRAAERGGLQIHLPAAPRRVGRHVGLAPQRRRQRRHVDGADHPGAPRAVPHLAAQRASRSLPTLAANRPAAGAAVLFAAHGRPGSLAAHDDASDREPSRPAGHLAVLFRRFLVLRRGAYRAHCPGIHHASFDGGEGGATWAGSERRPTGGVARLPRADVGMQQFATSLKEPSSVKGGHCGFFGWGMLVISYFAHTFHVARNAGVFGC